MNTVGFLGAFVTWRLGVVSTVDWPATFESLASVAQVIALLIAGIWTYRLFVRQRLGQVRANIEHLVQDFPLQGDLHLLRVVMEIRNVGTVLLRPEKGEVSVSRISPSDTDVLTTVRSSVSTAENNWPKIRTIQIGFQEDHFKLEPGEVERYPYDFVVEAPLGIVQVHSSVWCGDPSDPDYFWDETTIHRVKCHRLACPLAHDEKG